MGKALDWYAAGASRLFLSRMLGPRDDEEFGVAEGEHTHERAIGAYN